MEEDKVIPAGSPVFQINHICEVQTGPVKAGEHTCVICKGEVIMCGSNAAPIVAEGRCCNKCNDSLVVPRRIGIMRLIETLGRASRTPFDAIDARDRLIGEFIGSTAVSKDAESIRTITSAEIVVWDSALERAALRGAENFAGEPWDVKPCTQWLILSNQIVLLLNGDAEAHAVRMVVSNPRAPVTFDHYSIRRGQLLDHPASFWISMKALQSFMELEIVQREAARLPRQAKRLLERQKKPIPTVMIVRLRRIHAEQGTGETDVQWQHRWMVRGHWRRQWYASEKKHRLIYIAQYIKGPEGKPFMPPRDRVIIVNR